MKIFKIYILLLISVSFMSCQMYEPDPIKKDLVEVPKKYENDNNEKKILWWESFHNKELNNLIEQGINENFTVKEAWSRLEQIKALGIKIGVNNSPTVNLTSDASRKRTDVIGKVSPNSNRSTTTKSYNLGFVANYEVDLWGKLKSLRDASKMDIEASQEDINIVKLSISANIAKTWLKILRIKKERNIKNEILNSQNNYLKLLDLKYKSGKLNISRIYSWRQQISKVERQIEKLNIAESIFINELNYLLGKTPQSNIQIKTTSLPNYEIKDKLALNLLENRPDIRKKWKLIRSSQYSKAVAKADKLPKLTLSAGASFSHNRVRFLFNNWFANIAAGLTAPLFDAGLRDAEIKRQKAIIDERINSYKNTVLIAIKEVENSLLNIKETKTDLKLLNSQIEEEVKVQYIEEEKYKGGGKDYLIVLDSTLKLLNYKIELNQIYSNQLQLQVDLHKAVGGNIK